MLTLLNSQVDKSQKLVGYKLATRYNFTNSFL